MLAMAHTGVDLRTLCLEFDIQHTTLRVILSGYANYKRYGGSEKTWTRYFEQHAHALAELQEEGRKNLNWSFEKPIRPQA